LLNPPEQKLFRRLSVFAGGCTLESVEAVCNVQRDLDISPLDGLASLVDKSLLAQTSQGNGELRFQMLETIREFGLEQLSSCGEMEISRRALAAYCLVLAEEGAQSMTVQGRVNWLALCDSEHDNFRAALDWLLECDHGEWALRFGCALYHYWERREYLAEGRARLLSILNLKNAQGKTKQRAMVIEYAASLMTEMNDLDSSYHWHGEALSIYRTLADDRGIACSLNSLGVARRLRGDLPAARSWFEQSLSVCERIGSEMEIAGAHSNLAQVVRAQGDYALAASLLERALTIFRRLEAFTFVAWSLNHLGDIARESGDPLHARQLYEEGADMFKDLGDRWGMARSRLDLGHLSCEGGDTVGATASFRMALEMFVQLDHKRGIAKVLEGFARVSVFRRDYLRAITLRGAATFLRHSLGAHARADEHTALEQDLAAAYLDQDPGEANAAWTAGSNMPLDRAIRYALEP
jgi:tetratricopeptide (TPR) repeat protein